MTPMDQEFVAIASTTIDAPVSEVWEALVSPEMINNYMFGAGMVTEWEEGNSVLWQGQAYEDKGTIFKVEPERVLQYSHFSPLSGQANAPENFQTVTIELSGNGGKTTVSLSQNDNHSPEAREVSEKNWRLMLEGLRELIESDAEG